MHLLERQQRISLRQLACPQEGLWSLGILGSGLTEYLRPHCERTGVGTFYLRSAEARIAILVLASAVIWSLFFPNVYLHGRCLAGVDQPYIVPKLMA